MSACWLDMPVEDHESPSKKRRNAHFRHNLLQHLPHGHFAVHLLPVRADGFNLHVAHRHKVVSRRGASHGSTPLQAPRAVTRVHVALVFARHRKAHIAHTLPVDADGAVNFQKHPLTNGRPFKMELPIALPGIGFNAEVK